MRKQTRRAGKRYPKCGKIESQVKAGYNASGSQRCKCKECDIYYTIAPKQHEYPEETRELAIKMYYGGISGRGLGKIQERTTEKESTIGVNVVELGELYWYLEHKPGTETRENIYIMTMVSRKPRQIVGNVCKSE